MKRWRSWSLRRRVLVASSFAVTAVVVLGVVAFGVSLDRILYGAALDAARLRVTQVADRLASGEVTAGAALQDVPGQGSLLQVLGADGRVVAASEQSLGRTAITDLRPVAGAVVVTQQVGIPGELGEPHAVVAQGVKAADGVVYVVVVATPLSVENDTVTSATTLLALGAAVLLALLLILINLILKQALEPVERIRSEVARITQVRDGGTITVPPSGDEIARLAETMNLMLRRLEDADASSRRFVSDASHELRSPLATIRAVMEVDGSSAIGAVGADADRDDLVTSEILRMQQLVGDLLTLAKADDGGVVTIHEDVDVDDLVDAEVRRLRMTGTLTISASIEPARVVGDRGRLAQVVRNLVDNAARYARSSVRLTVLTEGDEVVLVVDNDGPVIPPEDRELVFERFSRLETSRDRDAGGSGLGLAIVRTFVAAHDGTVTAGESSAGLCRFEVRLPLAR